MSSVPGQIGRRREVRFAPVDFGLWDLEVAGKSMPASWIIDLNDYAVRVRMGQFGSLKTGDVVSLKIVTPSGTLFHGQAKVMWCQPSSEHVNLNDLGLRFLSHPLRALPENELQIQNRFISEVKTSPMDWPANQFLLSVAMPFLLGFVWQLPFIQNLLH